MVGGASRMHGRSTETSRAALLWGTTVSAPSRSDSSLNCGEEDRPPEGWDPEQRRGYGRVRKHL